MTADKIVDIPLVRHSVHMETVLAAYGIETVRGKAICPFHTDHRPSMKVYPDGYYCFACGSGGDTIKFVARIEGVSNADAAAKVAEIGGMILPQNDFNGREKMRRIAAERKRREREALALRHKYTVLCSELHAWQRTQDEFEPLGAAWCYATRHVEKLEVQIDEINEQLAAANI